MIHEGAKGLEKLLVWRKSMEFAVTICRTVVPTFPPEEKYALADQLRRAAQSIPANIAEGYGRYYYQENIRFCYVSRGSISEVFSHLNFAFRMRYLPEPVYQQLDQDIQELLRLVNGYITFLRKTKQGEGDLGHTVHDISPQYGETADQGQDDNPWLTD